MKIKNNYLLLCTFFVLLLSCEDIIETDISNDEIMPVFPLQGDTVEGSTVQFLWNEIDGAEQYNLQVFDGVFIEVDTLIAGAPFTINLDASNYQWRLRGENDAYTTPYTFPIDFSTVTSIDLNNQIVMLNSPSNNLYTNNNSILFVWDVLEAATSYDFELLRITTSGSETIFIMNDIADNTLSLTNAVLNQDGEYQWRVRAKNDTSETAYTSRTLFLDTTVPNTPSLITPVFEEVFTVNETITFSWNYGTDPGNVTSEITSLFEISTTQDFSIITESSTLTEVTLDRSFATSGTYYWRVTGEDLAGNIGSVSTMGKFDVNE